jgi:hypothetical protein
MQEQIKFSLSKELLKKDAIDIDTLKNEINSNIIVIAELLTSYHFKSRERVFDVSINENSVEIINSQIGKFIVNYTIGQFNACADVDFTERASMEMLVDVDLINQEAIVTGEYIPEREPDEF